MDNDLSVIAKKVNIIYVRLIVISLILSMLMSFGNYTVLNATSRYRYGVGYFVLSSILANVVAILVITILLIALCKIFANVPYLFSVIGIIVQLLCYILFTIFVVSKKVFPLTIQMTIISIIITSVLFVFTLIPAVVLYGNILILNQLLVKIRKLCDFNLKYRNDVGRYNKKVDQYNDMNFRIEKSGQAVGEKYHYKEIHLFQEYMDIPRIKVSDIHLIYCTRVYTYFTTIELYQSECEKILCELREQCQYIDAVVIKKMCLVEELERNVDRINDTRFTEKTKQIFVDTTIPTYKHLKEKKAEKKIKSMRRRFKLWKIMM